MNILSSDFNKGFDVGSSDIWKSLFSTIYTNLSPKKASISLALQILHDERCPSAHALETARQFNLIRDMLSQFSPDHLVYDCDHPKKLPPWAEKISPVVTSCANFYTTADGEDLLYEIVRILCYAGVAGVDVIVQ